MKGLEKGVARVVKKNENSRKDGKSNRGDFLIFFFPINAFKIELWAFIEAGTFVRVDGKMLRVLAYFDNPGWQMPVYIQEGVPC